MPLLEWDHRFTLNIEEIDSQHKQMFSIINDLHDAMSEGKGRAVLSDIFKRIVDYSRYHFDTEEKYFHEFDFEFTKEHETQHRQYIERVEELHEKFLSGSIALSIEVMNFLKDWWASHIKGSDQLYYDCFHEHGVK